MKLLIQAGVCAGLLLAAPASFVHAQAEQPKPLPVSPAHRLFNFIEDLRLHKELGLTPEQVTKCLALQQKVRDDHFNATLEHANAKAAEWNRATAAALKDILDAKQFQRAEQLGLQVTWAGRDLSFNRVYAPLTPDGVADPTRVRADVLNDNPTVAEALKLSEDQQKLAVENPPPADPNRSAIRNRTVILLTPEQTETARTLLGPLVPTRWKVERDRRMDRYYYARYDSARVPPGLLRLLSQLSIGMREHPVPRDIATELKLTEEQETAIAPLRLPWKTFGEENAAESPAELLRKADALVAENEKALARILKPEQFVRLRQLAVRKEHDPAWGDVFTPLVVNLAEQLKATPEQRKAFEAVLAKHEEAVRRAALAGEGYDAAHKAIRAANRQREADLEAVLTAEQKTALQALVGDQLPGRVERDYGPRFGSDTFGPNSRVSSFGHYSNELNLLMRNKTIQTELKLTPDQLDLATKASRELTRFGGVDNPFGKRNTPKLDRDEQAAERDRRTKFIGDTLAAVLDPAQAKRFREIMMQQRHFLDENSSRSGIRSAVTYPDVAEAVKLTAEQKKRLIDGEYPADILTDEQLRAIREMLGERYGGDYEAAPGFGARPPATARPTPTPALTMPVAFFPHLPWDGMKVTPEQVTKLVTVINRDRSQTKDNPPTSLTVERLKLQREMQQIVAPNDGPKLVTRINQLLLQSMAAVNLPKALALPAGVKALGLTPVQTVRMADLQDEYGRIAELVGHARLPLEQRNEVLRGLRNQLDDRILALLTPEQTARWKELTGEPYAGFVKSIVLGPPRRTTR